MSEQTQLTLPERAAVALGAAEYEKRLVELSKKYSDITAIANVAGRDQCHSAYMELKNTRVAIERAGKDAREDANAFQKAVIDEVKRLTAITAGEEARLQTLRDEFDAEREREKQAKAAAEKARVDGIRKRIAEIQAIPAMLVGKQSQTIAAAIESLEAVEITLEAFAEFAGESQMVKVAAVAKLGEMLSAQIAHEEEQKRLQAEREQLARERAEAAERERIAAAERAEEERKAREAREAEEARLRAEREKHEAAIRAERERIEAAERAAQEKENAAFLAERKAAALTQAAMSEIQGIQQQVMIATMGRSGVRKGGTIECIRETLAETEGWEIGERFGVLQGAAEMAKTTAVAEIRRLLAEAEARAIAETEEWRKREEAEAAARAEAARLESERRAAEQEQIRREREQFAINGPGDVGIVKCVANYYSVTVGDVMQWMKKFDYAATDEYFAAANVSAKSLEKSA